MFKSFLLLDAESPKAVLPARIKVSLYTNAVVHRSAPLFG